MKIPRINVEGYGGTLLQRNLKMKFSLLFFFVTLLNLQAESTYSQKTRITLDLKEVSVLSAIEEIEATTEFSFFYSKSELDLNRKVNIVAKKLKIDQVLQRMFNNGKVSFKVIDKQIVLKPKNESFVLPENSSGPQAKSFAIQQAISGTVTDPNGTPLPGASVVEKGTNNGAQTDFDGNYAFNLTGSNPVIVVSYIGFKTQEITVNGRSTINVMLQEDAAALDEVVVVGFGTQKKEAVVGAMTSIKPAELKIPASNLTTALAGRLSGVVSFQTSGEPGQDNAEFFVRGVASFNGQNGPLILIDGVELTVDDLSRLQPDDIESFSVLKDPTTTAIYGARGANGIILVTTKTGIAGKPIVNLRYETSVNAPNQLVELADPITYMTLQNEADRTRGRFPTFTEERVAQTRRGVNPELYPTVDWFDQLFQDYALASRVNLNVRGGGEKVRYYVAGSMNLDDGLLKSDADNPFNNNIKQNRYVLRSNINIDLHENTEMIVRLNATIDDYRGPIQGGNAIYNAAVRTSPVRFNPVIRPNEAFLGVPHITFGNDRAPRSFGASQNFAAWFNPYAELNRGYRDFRRQLSLVQIEFKQDLASILPGLSARFLGNINTTSSFSNTRVYNPFFYRTVPSDNVDGYTLIRTTEGNESLELTEPATTENSVMYMEAAVNYGNTFNEKHNVTGLLVFTAREFLDGNASSVQLSLPSRNITLAGRYNYDYDNRYFAEFNFGYNGSERFAKKNRFGFFPSFGAGWLVSNEKFFKSDFISRLKLRASYGWVGNDRIGNTRSDRFFYLSEVNIDSPGRGYLFGNDFNNFVNGVSINRYANPEVTWETAEKGNLGLELNLFNDAVQFRTDAFTETRTNILQTRIDIPTTLGLQAQLATNVGEVKSWGVDSSLDINHSFNADTWINGRATFVWTDNEFKVFEEPDYASIGAPARSNIGVNVNVGRGFIAERLFVDDEEALNSPQQFGTPGVNYGGGDIKYKDINGDGIISDLDRVPIGKPTIPKITYGFGLSGGHKRWDVSVFFQGLAETSFFINPVTTGPFVNSIVGAQTGGDISIIEGNGILTENGLLKAFADDHWSEENRDVYALWPRLSTEIVPNNVQTSTWWLRDGSFIRLKQVELGFNLLKGLEEKLKLNRLRIYATGTNLITWSKFKLWDPELKGNGLNYPLQRTFNLGFQIGF